MVPQRLVGDLVADLSDQLGEDGLDLRIKRLGDSITKKEQATEVLRIAALIASVSEDVSAIEREVLEKIATAFKLDAGAVDSALEDVKKSLAP
jgi:tellurite resistance protein